MTRTDGLRTALNRDDLTGLITEISAAVDASYPPSVGAEAHMWRRVVKISEELGEVTEALLGLIGENPRKGVSATSAEVEYEILDVALAALGAWSYFRRNEGDPVEALRTHAFTVAERLADTLDAR